MNKEIYDLNFNQLKKYNESVAIELANFKSTHDYSIEIDSGKDTTLVIDGRQLTSHHDRAMYASIACSKLDLSKTITIYGFGLGDEIRHLLNVKKIKQTIQVVLLNPALFIELLSIDDELHTLFESNVKFIIPNDKFPIATNSIYIIPELYLDTKTYNNLKFRILNRIDNDYAIKYFEKTIQPLFDANLKENFEYLRTQTALSNGDLKNYKKTFMVIASGPSLDDGIDEIKKERTTSTVVCVDTALNVLERHGIQPDIIVTTDACIYSDSKKDMFSNVHTYQDALLIYSAHSQKEFISKFNCTKRFIYSKNDLKILNYLDKNNTNFLDFHGSVLNEAVAVALQAKATTIKLFGADFAYKDDLSHAGAAKGIAIGSDDSKLEVLCNDGRMQHTLRNFVLYKEYLENVIEKNPNVSFENYSKTGAVIEGAIKK